VKKLCSKRAKNFTNELRTRYRSKGEGEALEQAHELLNEAQASAGRSRKAPCSAGSKARADDPDEPTRAPPTASRMPG